MPNFLDRVRFFAYRAALFSGMRIASWFVPRLRLQERRVLAAVSYAMVADDGRFVLMARTNTECRALLVVGGHATKFAVEADAVAACSLLLQQITPAGKPN